MINAVGFNHHTFSCSKEPGKIDSGYRKISRWVIDMLTLCFSYIQHWLIADSNGDLARQVFSPAEVRVVCSNMAKPEDFERIIRENRTLPFKHEDLAEEMKPYGLVPKQPIQIKPIDYGKCFGSVIHFLRFGNAKAFEGGIPYEAVMYQAKHNSCSVHWNPEMEKKILKMIEGNDSVSSEEWVDAHGKLPLFKAIQEYLENGHHPRNGRFVEAIQNTLKKQDLSQDASIIATLREVALRYEKMDLINLDVDKFAFALGRLKIDEVKHYDAAPQTVLNEFKSALEPGNYSSSITTFNSRGQEDGEHIIAIRIDDTRKCTILDANLGIGECDQKDLPTVMNNIFSFYTEKELSFSRSLLFGKIDKGFSLLKVSPI